MTETCTISLTQEGKIIFEALAKKMPGFTFSGMLREVSRHYIICNSKRPGDPPELVADASAFRREFGWEPRHSDLDTIVATAWAWLRKWKGLDS